jgi:SAM-dependent methyltransferase
MDAAELELLTSIEDRHWWYRERRAILARELRSLPGPGMAVDIGAAGGGNTRVLVQHGWQALPIEYSTTASGVARSRGLSVIRADARDLPVKSDSCGIVTAFDILEHIQEDYLAAAEIARVLRPGGTALIAVPCDMSLWSAHDEAVGHVRRYTRPELSALVEKGGLTIERLWSWNVLLRPLVAMRRKSSSGSDLDEVAPVVNRVLTSVIVAERYLPLKSAPGVSLMLRARKQLASDGRTASRCGPEQRPAEQRLGGERGQHLTRHLQADSAGCRCFV